jgi:hypothetical protein
MQCLTLVPIVSVSVVLWLGHRTQFCLGGAVPAPGQGLRALADHPDWLPFCRLRLSVVTARRAAAHHKSITGSSTTATLTAGLATGSFWLNVLEGLPDALPESCLAPAMVARIDILPGTEASRQGPP